MPNILEKLDFVRFTRPYYPWLMGLGISKKTIGDIKSGVETESEALISALVHCENVSRSWLTEDIGPPFTVADINNDDECSELLSLMLEDEQWTVYIANDGFDKAIILTQPAQHKRPRIGFIEYTLLEVLPHAGEKTLKVAYSQASILKQLDIEPETLDKIITGQVGTYWIAERKPTAILDRAEIIPISKRKAMNQAKDSNNSPNMYQVNDSSSEIMDEEILLKNYRLLTDDNKKLVQGITRNLR